MSGIVEYRNEGLVYNVQVRLVFFLSVMYMYLVCPLLLSRGWRFRMLGGADMYVVYCQAFPFAIMGSINLGEEPNSSPSTDN